ncbi:porin [Variovorax sp. KK3]|uniref:porin n=1 Tax=Variovorax sp. KK3 TaxID=1855728 RepID=UPI00097CA5DA|nr:porin [Variovorax sp. KK3]
MKKCSLAIAVLAASGGASAQSSVTVFGIVDAAVSHYSVKSAAYGITPIGSAAQLTPSVQRSQTALSSGGYLPSRLGFRGTEDLGGGLSAGFWLESPITNDDGAVGLSTFSRRSTVSLSGPFGELRLGRDYTPTFWLQTLFDPFGNIGVGGTAIGSVGMNLTRASALAGGGLLNGGISGGTDNYARSSNMVGYFLPPNLGGFYGQLQYALHENVKSDDILGSPSKRGQHYGFRFGYADSAFDVAASYTESVAIDSLLPNGNRAERKIKNANLGASYDFGVVKLFAQLSRVIDDAEASALTPIGRLGSATKDKYTGALVGLTVPVGPGLIRAAYSRVKFKDDPGAVPISAFGTDLDASVGKLAIGYVHNLSKRTALYATAARIRIRDGQNNPAVMGIGTGGSAAYLSTGAGVGGYAPRSAMGYDFGIRHTF